MNKLLFGKEVQVKSMEQTVKYAEQHLGEICSLMASYTRKTARLRDKADLLVAQLLDFSVREDTEVQVGIKNIAEDLAMVQDYRQAQVERLETRVVAPLKAYGDIVKNKRADLKKYSVDEKKQLKELQRLERIQLRNPADQQSISDDILKVITLLILEAGPTDWEGMLWTVSCVDRQAEVNAVKDSTNGQRSIRQLEETIEDFQRQKLEDIKRIFTDFITLEMVFHAKALEIYTHTYHNLEPINTSKDLEA
ncbi:CBY1-interacting BAR domain-containing protein 2-like [Spinachia spinachia]